MEDLKEMFAQMMKFQTESQQKNEEKQQRFFLELQKQQEALFKSLSNNQRRDSSTIFSQNAVGNALETFSYAPDEDKTVEAYYRRYENIYITDCADWTETNKFGYFYES